MPSGKTTNYQLSQWVKTDKVLMEDFNADNKKIDDAIKKVEDVKAEKSALSSLETAVSKKAEQTALDDLKKTVAAHAAALDGKGNCKIHTQSYTGTGTSGADSPSELTFPGKPAVVFIGERTGGGNTLFAFHGQTRAYAQSTTFSLAIITWGEKTMSWHGTTASGQLNQKGTAYDVVALIEL